MKKVIFTLMSFAPTLTLAAIGTTSTFLTDIQNLIKQIIPIVFAIAIIYFFWGLITFVRSAGDPKAAAEGKGIMIYGVIAIAVMISIYGLVAWLQNTLGVSGTTPAFTLPGGTTF